MFVFADLQTDARIVNIILVVVLAQTEQLQHVREKRHSGRALVHHRNLLEQVVTAPEVDTMQELQLALVEFAGAVDTSADSTLAHALLDVKVSGWFILLLDKH